MKKILLLITGIFLFNLISGISICVDHDPPSAPTNLIMQTQHNRVQLNWDAAVDEPACSGVSSYDIYRSPDGENFSWIERTSNNSFLDEGLRLGTYEYMVHSWDLAGHNEGNGVSNSIFVRYTSGGDDRGSNGGSSSGGGSSGVSSNVYWECSEWGDCVDGIQSRTCVDTKRTKQEKTELKECSNEIVSFSNQDNENEINSEEQSTNYFTGAVAGITNFAKSEKGLILFIVTITIVAGVSVALISV